ncbi:MAG: site-specific integrase [Prevotella sp.]|nr:site-specific integrase [Prevotella sp.]
MEKGKLNFTKEEKLGTRKYSSRGISSLAKFTSTNGSVYGTLALDTRRGSDDDMQELPVAVRVAYNGKSVYLRIGKKYTMEEWLELCECEKQGRNKKSAERKELKALMQKVESQVNQLIAEGSFSLRRIQEIHQGKPDNDSTIYSIWDSIIASKQESEKAGTARCNKDVRRRFERDMGSKVEFADINKSFIDRWVKKMKENGLSLTTIGITLRTFRAIVNACIDRKLIKGNTKDMFKDTGYNKSCSRKYEFLDVPTMRVLYGFWERGEAKDEKGKELFFPKEKNAIFRDLGLFLFMYLGDGQNLADTLRLTYDEWYFATHGKQLRFLRHKTQDRNESASEVIFPVTAELKKIIDRYGNKPEPGARVFPIMDKMITADKEVWVIQRYNRYIREHMAKVSEIIGLEQSPTSTWARHSFATNLNNSGKVPYKYISDSMGHSGSGDVTSNYIGAYPLDKMLEYNAYLLDENGGKKGNDDLLERLKGLSEEDRKKLLEALSKSMK